MNWRELISRRLLRTSLVNAAILLAVRLGCAQISSDSPAPDPSSFLLTRSLSRARSLRTSLEQHGYSFQLQFVQDLSKTIGDEDEEYSGLGRYSLDLSLTVDGGKALGWRGSTGYVRLKQHQKEFGGEYEVSEQLYSNIDGPSRTWIYELWAQQSLLDNKLRIKAGKIDANTEFALVPTAADFLNASMGFSPTILGFPTYPDPKLSFEVFVHPWRQSGLSMGVFQTSGMGTMAIVEPQQGWSLGTREHHGRTSMGYWRLDGDVLGMDGRNLGSTQGLYAVVEQEAWKPAASPRSLSTFLQLGAADGQASLVTRHFGAGAVLQSPFRSRKGDTAGLAATWIALSSQPSLAMEYSNESVFEAYYKLSISRQVALLQDFQFVHHPAAQHEPDCGVFTERLLFTF